MRKLLTIIALFLIATALLGPGLTGRVTERMVVANNDNLAASLPDWLLLVEQQFNRGWFNSTSRYRLVITDPERVAMFAQMLGVTEFADQPAITVESIIAHGPLVGLFTPAIGRVESRFLVDAGAGRKHALPVTLTSTLGLTGHSLFVATLGAGGISNERLTARWDDVTFSQRMDNKLANVSVGISTPSLSVMPGPGKSTTSFDDLDIDTTLIRTGERLRLEGQYSLERHMGDAEAASATNGAFAIDDIPLRALPALREPIREAAAVGVVGLPTLLEAHLPAMLALLDGNLAIEWSQQTRAAAGEMDLGLTIDMPNTDSIASGNPQDMLQQIVHRTQGTLKVNMSVRYAEQLAADSAQMYQQLTMMRGMGFLAPDASGEYLAADIDYADGTLSVNGLPMPVSAPPSP